MRYVRFWAIDPEFSTGRRQRTVHTIVCRYNSVQITDPAVAGKSLLKCFAAEVRRSRTSLGLSQEQLADRANLDRNYIGMIERGERAPTLPAIAGIAQGLQLGASEFIA